MKVEDLNIFNFLVEKAVLGTDFRMKNFRFSFE